ncbi:hypothetical protein K435DRAFT_671028, partial [Dendrothele bispora CBS 962.96]
PAYYRLKMDLWVATRQRPYSILKDPELVDGMKILNPNIVTNAPSTVSSDIKEIRSLAIVHIANALQNYPGYLHLSFDGWTAPNVLSFLGVDVNYCNEHGELVNFTLDFTP